MFDESLLPPPNGKPVDLERPALQTPPPPTGTPVAVPPPVRKSVAVPSPTGTPVAVPPPTGTPVAVPPPARQSKKTRKSKKPLLISLAAAASVIIIVAGVFVFMEVTRSNNYSRATTQFEQGQYAQALEGFLSLGTYQDSESMVSLCTQYLLYEEAQSLFGVGDYEHARARFEQLLASPIADVSEWINKCEYAIAEKLFGEGDLESALTAFRALGDYSDSAERVKQCSYEMASLLYDAGDFERARAAFRELVGYSDATVMVSRCSYEMASQLYNAGQLEQAYNAFRALGGFEDARDRAAACTRPFPSSGVLWQAPGSYVATSAIEIDYRRSTGGAYYKIYSGSTLVATLFVNANSTARVYLQPGNYIVKEGTGDVWFGEQLAFGQAGRYLTWTYDETGTDYLTLGYGNLITLSVNVNENPNVHERGEDYSSF